MELKEKHWIQGKWVDCKTAVPVNKMKEMANKMKLD
jgi:hypothetical protein